MSTDYYVRPHVPLAVLRERLPAGLTLEPSCPKWTRGDGAQCERWKIVGPSTEGPDTWHAPQKPDATLQVFVENGRVECFQRYGANAVGKMLLALQQALLVGIVEDVYARRFLQLPTERQGDVGLACTEFGDEFFWDGMERLDRIADECEVPRR